ncbi:MAG: PHP domain-containing protein [Victivallales bacterium]|nr:PHP domain-containing protein [Victivallales bacterium]
MMHDSCRLVDLHVHSTASDGSMSPGELVDTARSLGLAALALTDHDTISGLPEFLRAAEKFDDIEAVPGVEISVAYNSRELHLLGLFISHSYQPMENMLCEIRRNRNTRNELIVEKLRDGGYEITGEELAAAAGGESVGRPILAKVLVEKGYFKEPQDAFDSCLNRGGHAYVARVLPSPEEAIDMIHMAGGIAVWAHPLHRARTARNFLRNTLRELSPMGLDAVEAYYTSFSDEQTQAVSEIAAEFGMPVSGGSDFHGSNQPGVNMGSGYGALRVPYSVFYKLKYLRERKN